MRSPNGLRRFMVVPNHLCHGLKLPRYNLLVPWYCGTYGSTVGILRYRGTYGTVPWYRQAPALERESNKLVGKMCFVVVV